MFEQVGLKLALTEVPAGETKAASPQSRAGRCVHAGVL